MNWANLFTVKEGLAPGSRIAIPVSVKYPREFNDVLRQYEKVFSQQGTGIKHYTASMQIKPDAIPVYEKSRPVPNAILPEAE